MTDLLLTEGDVNPARNTSWTKGKAEPERRFFFFRFYQKRKAADLMKKEEKKSGFRSCTHASSHTPPISVSYLFCMSLSCETEAHRHIT